MNEMDYFWNLVFNSLLCAMVCFGAIAIAIALINYTNNWFKVRKHIMKYRKGYNNAIKDAIDDVNALYDEWNADDPLADIPNQKTIVARLENLKYVNKRNIPTE